MDFNMDWLKEVLILVAKHSSASVAGRKVYELKVTHFPDCASFDGGECDCIPDVQYAVQYEGAAAGDTKKEDCG